MNRSIFFFSFSVALLGSTALADTVELSGGGHLTGKVQRLSEQKVVIVQIDDDLRIAVPENRVRRVVVSERLSPYEERAAKAGEDAELHYQLAIWCVKAKNFPGDADHYKRFHMRRAVELDPDHAEARASLGYIKDKGQWVRTADLMRRRGMILHRGKWQLPEAVARGSIEDETDEKAKRWVKEVGRLTAVVLRGSSKSGEALETLTAIEDPLAASAVAQQLKNSRGKRTQSRQLRMLWVKLLGRFKNGESVKALVEAGIDEPDEIVREAALEQLQDYGSSSAVATYLPMLKSNDNKRVNKAARALSWFPDPELALTYTEALVTKHTKEVAPGAGTQAGFTQNGSGSFSTGGKKTVITTEKTNPSVLALLTKIEPGANYSYDEKAWRAHFAAKRTSYEGDLRRDP